MQRGSKRNRQLDFLIGTPLLYIFAAFHRKRKAPADPQRVGVMCSPALGDTLLFSATLQDLRAAHPYAHIVHVCMKQNLAAAEIIAGAAERVLIDLTSPLAAVRILRAQRLDVLLDFTGWQRLTAFLTLTSGAKYTVGFRSARQHRSPGYDRTVDHAGTRHELENFRALVRGSGLVPADALQHEPRVDPGPSPANLLPGELDIVAFHPWASGQASHLREWPADRWLALAQELAQPDTLFVITGGPGDQPRATALVASMHAVGLRAATFISPDGFRSLTHLLRRARVVISVNTGVMHLAAIAGAPTVSLNGPTAEHRWGARGPRVANVQPDDGSGGYLHFGFEFGNQPEDIMQRITVQQVAEACEKIDSRKYAADR